MGMTPPSPSFHRVSEAQQIATPDGAPMNKHTDVLKRLPELPVELFERSGKLDYSQHAPVITIRPNTVTAKPPGVAAAPNRASHELRTYFAWVLYPHVVCTPIPDLEILAALELQPDKPPSPRHAADLAAVADTRHFYKLSRFQGRDLVTPWGCEVRYGPWFGTIAYTQSCDDHLPDRWILSSPVLSMQIAWEGSADDMPAVPNLTVVWDPNQPADVSRQCCPGYRWCPSSQSCLPNSIDCPGLTPL